jgi:hypothetical protein
MEIIPLGPGFAAEPLITMAQSWEMLAENTARYEAIVKAEIKV